MKIVHQRIERRRLTDLVDSLAYDWLNRSARGVAERRGHKMAVFANDLIGNSINLFGAYEREEIATMFDFLAPHAAEFARGVALDIGANIGNHALAFAPHFREVHAFEPNPQTHQLLTFNAQFRENIRTHRFGLGDQTGEFRLAETENNVGQSAVDAHGTIAIDLRRLDDLEIADVRFIKMDVEGYERQVIDGGKNFLREQRPILAFEQLAHEFDGDATPTIRALRALGYRFCWLEDGAQSHRRLASFTELATGRRHKVVSGEVPARTHSLIIALPTDTPPRAEASV